MVLTPFAEEQQVLLWCQELKRRDIKKPPDCLIWSQTDEDLRPLMALLTSAEADALFGEGLGMHAYDEHGREYVMGFKFDEGAQFCCLYNQWSWFLQENSREMKAGDSVKIWAFAKPDGEGFRNVCLRLLRDEPRQQRPVYWSVAEDELIAAEMLLQLE